VRIATFDNGRVGRIEGTEIVDLTALVTTSESSNGISAARRLIDGWEGLKDEARTSGPTYSLSAVRLDAPVPDPSKVIAAPVNYIDHKTEMSENYQVDGLGIFLKAPSSVIGHRGVVALPYSDRRFDHEAELAIVIGRTARNVSTKNALDHVFGYTGLLDITMRGGEDRSTRKSFDTFTPLGPWLVTPDEFGDPTDVDIQLCVNGLVRQKANTRDLIWDVAQLISYASSVMTLLPGDVISTGTPAGVGPIYDGDEVVLQVGRVGTLSVAVSDEEASLCPTSGAGRGPVPPPPKPVVARRATSTPS